ncbi:MAG TPA: aspartate-semialdehyde dehydrogenase [Longimicrobiales bacterium]|nr:aspartate-semialdehyde dehydrogenase [Longimicrobiales bacterium]
MDMDARIPVGVLGATGAVGQTFVRLLDGHPLFKVAEVAASERSAGRTYREATHWLAGDLPADVADLSVLPCEPGALSSRVVFSALDSSVAGEVEAAFAQAGAVVLSNAKNHRMDADVPLVIPEVNAAHLGILDAQRANRGWTGAVVTNANCAATMAALALAPLHQAFGLRRVFVTTLQAVSGAGYPGVASLDILGNVIPFIGGDEEEKIETELPKLLGALADGAIRPGSFAVSAQVNRVPVEHGHTVCMSVELEQTATAPEAALALDRWRGDPVCAGLPSAPERPVMVTDEANRPQPRKDVDAGRGMSVVVGRVRPDPILHLRLVAMGHNTIRGAAGGSVLNAEVMSRLGLLDG